MNRTLQLYILTTSVNILNADNATCNQYTFQSNAYKMNIKRWIYASQNKSTKYTLKLRANQYLSTNFMRQRISVKKTSNIKIELGVPKQM